MALSTGFGCINDPVKQISYSELPPHSEDSLINANRKVRALREPELLGRIIQIETTDGTVHLNGFVNNYFEAQRAEEIARGTPGVVSVRNNLRIRLQR